MIRSRSPLTCLAVLVAVLLQAAPPDAFAQETVDDRTGLIRGKVVGRDGKSAAPGTTIVAYHLASKQTFEADLAGGKGQFEFGTVPYGTYDLAVRSSDGEFLADRIVTVAPDTKKVLIVTLDPFTESDDKAAELREFPGMTGLRAGVARIAVKPTGAAYWKTPTGIAILVAGGSLILLVLATSSQSSDEIPASPTLP